MQSREKIREAVTAMNDKGQANPESLLTIILTVLLDIRDLLQDKK